MTNDIAIPEVGRELSVQGLSEQVKIIKQAMKTVMVKDTHYGTIPGCGDKPALLQPGAHKLGLMFNLAPEYQIDAADLAGEHREYEVVCRLTHRETGRFIGEGVGVCSTMESKYRYRWDDTGAPVPQEYWQTRDKEMLGGPMYVPRKVKGEWHIFQRVEHDSPADYINTAKKIAKKRAYNDAILTATAASDIFVPDDATDPEFIHPDEDNTAGTQPPSEADTIPFGKYKGQPWYEADNGWLHWCEKNASSDKMKQRARVEIDRRKQPGQDGIGEKDIRKIRDKLAEANLDVGEALEILKFKSLDEVRPDQVDAVLAWIDDPGTLPEELQK